MDISDEAVEAAARALDPDTMGSAGPLAEKFKEQARAEARAALEAAAPYMAAQVWDEGAVAGWKQSGEGFNAEYPDESSGGCSVDLSGNPYRNAGSTESEAS